MYDTLYPHRQGIIFFLFLAGLFLSSLQPIFAGDAAQTDMKIDYGIIAGEWKRIDGGYVVKVKDVKADGQAVVSYFNPKPIHVAEATISTEQSLIKLFIKFQDKNYEGSTYRLYYYAQKDALVGFYYQAAMDRTYEVIFLRKAL